jgi:hypothetical protein
MEFNLYGFPDDAVHVSCFCGEHAGAVELNTVFLVDAVLSYSRLVRIFQTDVAFMFCSHSCTLKMEAIRSSETSVLIRATRHHLPDDDNHQE